MFKKLAIKGFIEYLIYCITILIIAYFFERFFQMLMFILLFNVVQNSFLKRFHSDTLIESPIKALKWCRIITIVVEIVYLIFCKELDITLYNNLLIIFFIATSNALLQFFLERVAITKETLKDYNTLNTLCKEANLTEQATKRMIMKYVENKKYSEIADIECVDEESIKSSIRRSRRKLNI